MRANDCYRAFYGSVNYNELELKTFDVPVFMPKQLVFVGQLIDEGSD